MAENVGGIFYECTLDTRKLVDGRRVIDRELDQAAASFNKITAAIKLYAAAMALVKSAQMADDLRLLAARVQVAAGSLEAGAAAMQRLQQISQRTQTSIEANAAVFQRLNSSIRQMGGNQDDTLRVTELLGKAVKVSGANAQEAASAMTQFGQALGSGKLQGDELRSLLENAPYLMQKLAEGIGVPVGALRKLGEEGELTADVVTNALAKSADSIESDFKRLPQTFSGALAVMTDAAGRANEKLDQLTGASGILTGVVRGLGEVFDMLARQFSEATTEADRLGRNASIETWSAGTQRALSYVADAADGVTRFVALLGVGLGGLAAKGEALLTFNLERARERFKTINAEVEADVERIVGKQLAGAKMREEIGKKAPAVDGGAMSLFSEGGKEKKKQPPREKFDAAGYLAKLAEQTKDGLDRVNIIEEEALRKNAELLKQGKINREQAAQAVTLIEAEAQQERLKIQFAKGEEYRQYIEDQGKKDADAAKRAAEERARGQELARSTIAGGDPIAALQLELENRSKALQDAAARDLENADLYAQARVALEQQTWAKIKEVVDKQQAEQAAAQSAALTNYGNLFGSLSDIAKTFSGEQSEVYRAMFAVSKAFAIADAIVKIQQGVANALSLPYPANITAAASTAAAAAGIVGTIRNTNFAGGRQYGGPTDAGSLYRINETGAPEMFTAANGAQYMLPTTDGRVTPADQVGGGVSVQVQVNNMHPTAAVSARTDDTGRIVQITVAEIASQISSNRGPVWSALQAGSNIRSAL